MVIIVEAPGGHFPNNSDLNSCLGSELDSFCGSFFLNIKAGIEKISSGVDEGKEANSFSVKGQGGDFALYDWITIWRCYNLSTSNAKWHSSASQSRQIWQAKFGVCGRFGDRFTL